MATRTRDTNEEKIDVPDPTALDGSTRTLVDDLNKQTAAPITDPRLITGPGPRVLLDVTAMRQPDGGDCIEVVLPEGEEIHQLSGAASFRLAHDLKAVTDFVSVIRQNLGYVN
jgi:hypothetical protein